MDVKGKVLFVQLFNKSKLRNGTKNVSRIKIFLSLQSNLKKLGISDPSSSRSKILEAKA